MPIITCPSCDKPSGHEGSFDAVGRLVACAACGAKLYIDYTESEDPNTHEEVVSYFLTPDEAGV